MPDDDRMTQEERNIRADECDRIVAALEGPSGPYIKAVLLTWLKNRAINFRKDRP